MAVPLVFICYSRKDNASNDPDRRWLDRVRQHLQLFENQGDIEVFCDDIISFGDDWHERIQSQLQAANVAILLISSSFLASKYVSNGELPVVLQRASEGGLRIVPIIVSACNIDRVSFSYQHPERGTQKKKLSELQAAGSLTEALEDCEYAKQERILTQVAAAIADHVASLTGNPMADSKTSTSVLNSPTKGEGHGVPNTKSQSFPPQISSEITNSLGMRFVPVAGTKVGFCIWPTRVQDYATFAAEMPDLDGSWKDPVYEGVPVTPGPTHPVVSVSWEDAQTFCEWLTQRELRQRRLKPWEHYRLPTDLEWSAAVGLPPEEGKTPAERSGKITGVYPWGKEWPPPPGAGNFADETARKPLPKLNVILGYRDGFATTSPVGTYRRLKNGIYDLSGNVWEWCEDRYQEGSDRRVLRGGSWLDDYPDLLLSSFRFICFGPGFRFRNIGFRVVMAGDEYARLGGV